MGMKVAFCLYIDFHWRDFPETSYLASCMRALKRCDFYGDRVIINDTLLGEEHTFSCISLFPWNYITSTIHLWSTNHMNLVEIEP
jgi:hypothetical protein